ncbi:MAG: hypothetical protein U0441_21945 [Polyangiaceae bacterium]
MTGCSSQVMVPLIGTAGAPITLTPRKDIPLEVATRSTGIKDPLPVDGGEVAYGDVETALQYSISTAAVPWAEGRHGKDTTGYQLFAELIDADAAYHEGRLVVTLGVRATLRTREGQQYIAQTQVHCRQAGVVAQKDGAPIVYACMSQLGRDLAGWLGSVAP